MVQRFQLENWKLMGTESGDRNISFLVSCRAYRIAESGDGSTFFNAKIAGLKPKLHSSNKSPEYIYIYISIMRLLPSSLS